MRYNFNDISDEIIFDRDTSQPKNKLKYQRRLGRPEKEININKSSERRQIITMLKDEIPHLCFTHGIKQKLTTFMLQHFPYIYIELYNLYVQIIHRKVLTRTIFHKNSQ